MTALIQARDLGYTLGTKPLFEGLSFTLNRGDRVGLVGHNGAGKTSFLNLLASHAEPDAGEVVRRRGLAIGLVEQFVPAPLLARAVREAVLEVLPQEERIDYRADTVLAALGFNPDQMGARVEQLSGGQQNMVLLARAQVLEPELLLMDEPGNHMDVSALGALRQFLMRTDNLSYVLISHDRELLDDCCTRTTFLRDQTTYNFDLPYTAAREALGVQDAQAAARQQAEEKEINRIRKSAKRLAQWGKVYDNEDLARKAKTMAARADKLEADKTFVTRGSGLDLTLATGGMRTKTVVTLERFVVHALDDGRQLLSCKHLVARPGDRIALLGDNGSGKSTTIKRILDAEGDTTVRLNPNVKAGYVDQELEAFDSSTGRYDWLAERVDASDAEIKRTLLQAGVAYEDFGQSVSTLSGGEKARMMFMALRLAEPNLVILDEPTNHIDLESREQLEEQLQASGATLLITSHDRRFLEVVCNRFWMIADGQLSEVNGLDDYYTRVAGWRPQASRPVATAKAVDVEGEDAILARLDELEALLREDLARKPKFQKPARQAAWREEIEALWARLD